MTSVSEAILKIVPRAGSAEGTTKLNYAAGISVESVGAKKISMQIMVIPPGGKAEVHSHGRHETAAYIISGEIGVWFGENLEHHLTGGPGDFAYIPGKVPHQPYNLSDTEPAVMVIARTDPNEQENVVLLPALENLH